MQARELARIFITTNILDSICTDIIIIYNFAQLYTWTGIIVVKAYYTPVSIGVITYLILRLSVDSSSEALHVELGVFSSVRSRYGNIA